MHTFISFFRKLVFQFLNIIFRSYDLFETKKEYCFIPRSLDLCFRSILKILNIFNFVMFHHFWGQGCVLFDFFVCSRALLVQNGSFLTPLYLGKNYACWKQIVKRISKLDFSIPKNVNLGPPMNCQRSHWREGS